MANEAPEGKADYRITESLGMEIQEYLYLIFGNQNRVCQRALLGKFHQSRDFRLVEVFFHSHSSNSERCDIS